MAKKGNIRRNLTDFILEDLYNRIVTLESRIKELENRQVGTSAALAQHYNILQPFITIGPKPTFPWEEDLKNKQVEKVLEPLLAAVSGNKILN
jgi:hypothetical protein